MHEKKKRELYEAVSCRNGHNVGIRKSLCFYNPAKVYDAILNNEDVTKWLNFISNHYLPPPNKRVLLIYPCSSEKPYFESRSYKTLYKTLNALGEKRKDVHLMTISEPFGLVPEEFYGKKTKWHDWKDGWYDCPGLFEWWCNKHGQAYSKEHVDKSIELLAMHVADFLKKVKSKKSYAKIIVFVRTYTSKLKSKHDHTHNRIIRKAAEIANIDVAILPDRAIVSEIVENKGRMAWDMYGVSHPMAQEYLLKYLEGVLKEKWYTKLKRLFYGLLS